MDVGTFINRPILSGVISVAVVIVGLIGLSRLPSNSFPTSRLHRARQRHLYRSQRRDGDEERRHALEEQLNGVEIMILLLTSTATNTGAATINVYFQQGTDPTCR